MVFRYLLIGCLYWKYRRSQHVMFGNVPAVIRFSLAICPRAISRRV